MRPILPLIATLGLLVAPHVASAADNLVVKINVSVYALTLVWNTNGAAVVPADGAKTSEQRTWEIIGVWFDDTTLSADGVTKAGVYNTNVHGRLTSTDVAAGRVTLDTGWTSLKNKTGAAVDLSVKATDATWGVVANSAAVLAAANKTMIEVSRDAGGTYPVVLTTSNQVLASFATAGGVGDAIAADEIVPFDIRLTTPRVTGSTSTSGDLLVTVTSFISP
jgi:hypothetical protein